MMRIISRFIYHIIYTFFYVSPIIILMFAEKALDLNFDLRSYIEALGIFKFIIILAVVAYVFVLPGYRAKLASDAYGEGDIGFWEAHVVSGTILKSHLSFLPIIGKFFEKNESPSDN
jgi:hypothetical protein